MLKRHVLFEGVIFNRGRGGRYWGWALNGNSRKALVELGEAVYCASGKPLPRGARIVYLDGDTSSIDRANIALMIKGKIKKTPKKKIKATS